MKFPFRCSSCHELNPIEYKADDYYRFECHRCNQTERGPHNDREIRASLRLRVLGVPGWIL
jgi:hypothetical protein